MTLGMLRSGGLIAAMCVALLTQFTEVTARDFGTQGNIFEIQEVDMLDAIKSRLKHIERTGELGRMQEDMKAQAIRSASRPKVVEGLAETTHYKCWEFDPSYILKEDLKDNRGVIFHKAGTRVNPLEHRDMLVTLLFIDGDQEQHVKWALNIVAHNSEAHKIILIKGAPIDLMRRHKKRFYFDYEGLLVRKVGLRHVPAIVSQSGNKLLIQEVSVVHERVQ